MRCAIPRAICEEYRAAATLDHEHDAEDRRAARRIKCPMRVLWSGHGLLNTWYTDVGGLLALWRLWADDVGGGPLRLLTSFLKRFWTERHRN
jgi:haloacetate dehalogenase